MRDKLIQYINLLFAGVPDAGDIKDEIMQNTLDRYDDLIAQGKSPESAYSLSIAGIGDINELLASKSNTPSAADSEATPKKRFLSPLSTAVAIIFFILCPIPVILLPNNIGVCLLFLMVAAGVGLLIMNSSAEHTTARSNRSTLHKILLGIAWGCGITGFIAVSLLTGAWYITWLILPITVCTCGLINAIFDLNKVFLKAVVKIVIFVVLISILSLCLFGSYLASYLSFNDEHYIQIDGNTESMGSASSKQVKDISIQWVSGSITIQPGDVQDIQFYEDTSVKQEDKMVWKHEGDRLTIQFCKPTANTSLFGITDIPSKNLVVTVPRDWNCDELEIDSVSAEILIDNLSVREAELANVSGICRIYHSHFTDIDLDTVSGSIIFDGQAATLDITSISANCTAQFTNHPSEIDLETVSGDLAVILPQNCGFTMTLDSVSGELISDFPTTTKNKRYTYGDGVCNISANTVSGDILIKLPE